MLRKLINFFKKNKSVKQTNIINNPERPLAECILGTGFYLYRCEKILCRSHKPIIKAQDILDLFRNNFDLSLYKTQQVGYFDLNNNCIKFNNQQEIDLNNIPVMRDPLIGFQVLFAK